MEPLVLHAGIHDLAVAAQVSVLGLLHGYPLHLHAEGPRGAGKTTVLRGVARNLPPIWRLANCPYNCDPAQPHCPQHRHLDAVQREALGREQIPMPFLEISHNARIGSVAGSIDLARLTADRPEVAIRPGILARAHRGILFIDEINRLADTAPELADLLLDAMGTRPGRLQIEEAGVAHVELSVNVAVWAASNPDEDPGPLEEVRRQLADRFDLRLAAAGPPDMASLESILSRDPFARAGPPGQAASPDPREAPGTGGPEGLPGRPGPATTGCVAQGDGLTAWPARCPVGRAVPPLAPEARAWLAGAFFSLGLESLRAIQGWQAAARLLALREGASPAGWAHLRRSAAWLLRHRVPPGEIEQLSRELARREEAAPERLVVAVPAPSASAPGGRAATRSPAAGDGRREGRAAGNAIAGEPRSRSHGGSAQGWPEGGEAGPVQREEGGLPAVPGVTGLPGLAGLPGDARGRAPAGPAGLTARHLGGRPAVPLASLAPWRWFRTAVRRGGSAGRAAR